MRKIILFIILLYFIPPFFQFNFDRKEHIKSFGISLPRVISGDVPYTLLTMHSILHDSDFELKNNLNNIYEKKYCDAGVNQRGKKIPTAYFNKTTKKYSFFPKSFKDPNIIIYHSHPPGLAVLASILLWPFSFTCPKLCLLEPASVILSILAMLLGLYFLYKTIFYYSKEKGTALKICIIFALATPLWHYSSAFQVESFITPILIASFYLFFIQNKNFIPGIFLAIGFSMRFPIAVIIFIFGVYRLIQKRYKELIPLSFPVIGVIILLLFYNKALYGNYFAVPQAYYFKSFGNPLNGIFGSLFSLNQGILIFSPILLYSFLGIKSSYKKFPKDAIFIIILILAHFLIYTVRGLDWEGGCYANRYFVPLIPFLAVFFYFWHSENKSKKLEYLFNILLIFSFLINALAAFFPPLLWNKPPWHPFSLLFSKFNKIFKMI
ncbi:MAG: hypothetical protein HYU63_02650 [Armatimonadetes bacterium]|nr:hypothetical protein [Armatimonadota bacterium]